jgi:hypothetical protein
MAVAVLLVLVFGCGKGKGKDGSRAADDRQPAPPPTEIEPTDLPAVPLSFRGQKRPPITGKLLAGLKPDFESTEHRAWKLTSIIGKGLTGGDVIVVGSSRGVSVTYRVPVDATDRQPVLYMTRRGGLAATLVDPGKPFPEFHGQGGMLGRPGDSTPRVSPVLSVEVVATKEGVPVTDDKAAPAPELVAAAKKTVAELDVVVDGKPVVARAILEAMEPTPLGDDHADTRPTWSLRDIAARVARDGARVVALRTAAGDEIAIDSGTWADAARKPILRGNRRGELKFHWLSADGTLGPTQLRRVKRVEITSK